MSDFKVAELEDNQVYVLIYRNCNWKDKIDDYYFGGVFRNLDLCLAKAEEKIKEYPGMWTGFTVEIWDIDGENDDLARASYEVNAFGELRYAVAGSPDTLYVSSEMQQWFDEGETEREAINEKIRENELRFQGEEKIYELADAFIDKYIDAFKDLAE